MSSSRDRDSHGRYVAASAGGASSEATKLSDEEHRAALAEAQALKDKEDKELAEAKILRRTVDVSTINTIMTLAMIAKWVVVWNDAPLQGSGDADAMSKHTEILAWIERVLPKFRTLAPECYDLCCYVDYRIRGKLSSLLQFDPFEYDKREVDPRFVHDVVHGHPPEARRHGVRRTQQAVLMEDLSVDDLIRYTELPRSKVVEFLRVNWDAHGPLRARLDSLPTLGDRPSSGVNGAGDGVDVAVGSGVGVVVVVQYRGSFWAVGEVGDDAGDSTEAEYRGSL